MANTPGPGYWQQRATFYAQKYGIDPKIFLRQIGQESGFNPNAVSPAGAQGIAQIMPFWKVGTDPEKQLDWAAHHDAQNLAKYHNWQDTLSIYNSGKGWSSGQKIGETSRYVQAILAGKNPKVAPGGGSGPPVQPGGLIQPQGGSGGVDFRKMGALMLLGGGQTSTSDLFALAAARQQGAAATQAFGPQPQPGNIPRITKGSTLNQIEAFGKPYGLTITSTTGGKHAAHSYHYQGRAVDFGGDPAKMSALAKAALRNGGFTEFIYTGPGNPGYSILGGKVIPNSQLPKDLYAEHTNHVHLAK